MTATQTDCFPCHIYREYDNGCYERLTVEADVPTDLPDDQVIDHIKYHTGQWLIVGYLLWDANDDEAYDQECLIGATITSTRVDLG